MLEAAAIPAAAAVAAVIMTLVTTGIGIVVLDAAIVAVAAAVKIGA